MGVFVNSGKPLIFESHRTFENFGPTSKIMIIRPWALSPEGVVSNVLYAFLVIFTLEMNTKGPQEGVSKLLEITHMDFDHVLLACFFASCFVVLFQGLLGPSWCQLGANLGPTWALLEPTWEQLGWKIGPKQGVSRFPRAFGHRIRKSVPY